VRLAALSPESACGFFPGRARWWRGRSAGRAGPLTHSIRGSCALQFEACGFVAKHGKGRKITPAGQKDMDLIAGGGPGGAGGGGSRQRLAGEIHQQLSGGEAGMVGASSGDWRPACVSSGMAPAMARGRPLRSLAIPGVANAHLWLGCPLAGRVPVTLQTFFQAA